MREVNSIVVIVKLHSERKRAVVSKLLRFIEFW